MLGPGVDNRAAVVTFAGACASKAKVRPSDEAIVDMAIGLENALAGQMMLWLRELRGDARARVVKAAVDAEGQRGEVGLIDLAFRYFADEGLTQNDLRSMGERLSNLLNSLEDRTLRLFNGELD